MVNILKSQFKKIFVDFFSYILKINVEVPYEIFYFNIYNSLFNAMGTGD